MDEESQTLHAHRKDRRRRVAKTGLIALCTVVLLAVVALVAWVATPYRADSTAQAALESSDAIEVLDTADAIVFRPASPATSGFIFYPGGRVSPEAYAPLARRVADRGFYVAIVRMPLGLAVLDADAAARIIEQEPAIERWVVGGHSLGGAMAAQFAGRHLSDVSGLVLLAAYPPESTDLSGTSLTVLSIRGTADGLVSSQDIDASKRLLPAATRFVLVPGGNHAGFGAYGPQRGDGVAALPAAAQQAAAALEITNLLAPMNP